MGQVAALILALARAIPALVKLLDQIEAARANERANKLHAAIDNAIEQARRGTPRCPRADCPLRDRLHDASDNDRRTTPAPS